MYFSPVPPPYNYPEFNYYLVYFVIVLSHIYVCLNNNTFLSFCFKVFSHHTIYTLLSGLGVFIYPTFSF